jgi:hypothetical protein
MSHRCPHTARQREAKAEAVAEVAAMATALFGGFAGVGDRRCEAPRVRALVAALLGLVGAGALDHAAAERPEVYAATAPLAIEPGV